MERPIYNLESSGRRMREIRRAQHITVRQVMEFMGFESTQAVYKWEAGKCFPQADNLMALAKLYHVSPFELIVEEDTKVSSSVIYRQFFLNHWFVYGTLRQSYNKCR